MLPETFKPFMITMAPFVIFVTPLYVLYPQPFESKVPNEIKFFLKSVTCLTLPKVLTTPSNILILIVPIPSERVDNLTERVDMLNQISTLNHLQPV